MKNIVLIGMMGCGKTTLSQRLSHEINRPWIDLDDYLEKKYAMSISDMFDISEEYFRERETLCCQEVAEKNGVIISTGGGIIKDSQNIDILSQNGVIVFIDRPVEQILQDIRIEERPLLKDGPQKLYELYEERYHLYKESCHYHVINNSTIDDMIIKLKDIIEKM